MKKTIHIIIAKTGFYAEENAYELLKKYLDEISTYFKDFQSGDEIVVDIESSIAEKFIENGKLDHPITLEDVNLIIKTMGTIEDFEKSKTDSTNEEFTQSKTNNSESGSNYESKQRTFRDGNQKVIGGVLAGISHVLKIDMVWLRIGYTLLTIFAFIFLGPFGFVLIAIYATLWVIAPKRMDLAETKVEKKLYRNPENKIFGGVCSGLSNYLNIDLTAIRFIFIVLLFFGGIGILIYFIFLVLVPKVDTIPQKMEMSGQALTLKNIEKNATDIDIPSSSRTSTLANIIMFPFKIAGVIIEALLKILGPISKLFKVILGIPLFATGILWSFSLVVFLLVFLGVENESFWISGDEFLYLFKNDLNESTAIMAFIALVFPGIVLAIYAWRLITGHKIGYKNFWYTMIAVWGLSILGIVSEVGEFAKNFTTEKEIVKTSTIQISSDTLLIDLLDESFRKPFPEDKVSVRFETSPSDSIYIVQKLISSGENMNEALLNAQNIQHNFQVVDNTLKLEPNLGIKDRQVFRNQKVDITIQIPAKKWFKVSSDITDDILSYSTRKSLSSSFGLDYSQIPYQVYQINSSNEIVCKDIKKLSSSDQIAFENRSYDFSILEESDFSTEGLESQSIEITKLESIRIQGQQRCIITYSEKPGVRIYSSKSHLENLKIENENGNFSVNHIDKFRKHTTRVIIKISGPNIRSISLSGESLGKIIGTNTWEKFNADISGNSKFMIGIDSKRMEISASGSSLAHLQGNVLDLKSSITGASKLNLSSSIFENVSLDVSGSSEVIGKESKIQNLEVDASGASEVSLQKPLNKAQVNKSGASVVDFL
ncbi:MAG: PspC domain-containing protein [Leadbetterella sp.]